MHLTYRQLTTLRSLAGGLLLGFLIADLPSWAYLAMAVFLLLHWRAGVVGRSHRLLPGEYRFSSSVSSGVALVSFVMLLVRESIPILLAAVFAASSIIMLIFKFRLSSEVGEGRFKPMGTNWSLTASMLFLSCYFVHDQGLQVLSVLFLSYLLLALSVFTRKVSLLSRRRSSAPRR